MPYICGILQTVKKLFKADSVVVCHSFEYLDG